MEADNQDRFRFYKVFYSSDHQSKKRKTFKDGFLRVKGRYAELYNDDAKLVNKTSSFRFEKNDEDTDEGMIAGMLIQVEKELDEKDFLSGKCFMPAYNAPLVTVTGGPKPSLAATAKPGEIPKGSITVPVGPKKGFTPIIPHAGVTIPRPELSKVLSAPSQSSAAALAKKKTFVNPAKDVGGEEVDFSKVHILCEAGAESKATQRCYIDEFLMRELMPHQIKGVDFMFRCVTGLQHSLNVGCILGDSMGLGKTLQVISLLWVLLRQNPFRKQGGEREGFLKKVLVVCPVTLVKNWGNEFELWLKDKGLCPLSVNEKEEPTITIKKFLKDSWRILIISYEAMITYGSLFMGSDKLSLIVCDEGHRLKNTATKQYQALNRLACSRRIILTGTPIQNCLAELFSCIAFVNPKLFKDEKSFKKVYGDPISKGMMKGANAMARNLGKERSHNLMALLEGFMIRRTQKILEEFLPRRHEFIIYLRATDVQKELYNKSLELHKKLNYDERTHGYGEIFSILNVLRKILNHPKLLLRSDSELSMDVKKSLNDKLYGLDYAEDAVKFQFLEKILARMAPADKVIVVSYYTQTLDAVQDYLSTREIKFTRLDGSMTAAQRDDNVKKFIDMFSGVNIFLLAAKAGGTGLNLVAATRLILFDPDWNPSNDAQVMGRIYRKGQTRPVFIYRLVCGGTVEEKVMERQISKIDLSNFIIEDKDSQIKFTPEELKALFRPFDGSLSKFVRKRHNMKEHLINKVPDFERGFEDIIQYVLVDEEKEFELFHDSDDSADEEDVKKKLDKAKEQLSEDEPDPVAEEGPTEPILTAAEEEARMALEEAKPKAPKGKKKKPKAKAEAAKDTAVESSKIVAEGAEAPGERTQDNGGGPEEGPGGFTPAGQAANVHKQRSKKNKPPPGSIVDQKEARRQRRREARKLKREQRQKERLERKEKEGIEKEVKQKERQEQKEARDKLKAEKLEQRAKARAQKEEMAKMSREERKAAERTAKLARAEIRRAERDAARAAAKQSAENGEEGGPRRWRKMMQVSPLLHDDDVMLDIDTEAAEAVGETPDRIVAEYQDPPIPEGLDENLMSPDVLSEAEAQDKQSSESEFESETDTDESGADDLDSESDESETTVNKTEAEPATTAAGQATNSEVFLDSEQQPLEERCAESGDGKTDNPPVAVVESSAEVEIKTPSKCESQVAEETLEGASTSATTPLHLHKSSIAEHESTQVPTVAEPAKEWSGTGPN